MYAVIAVQRDSQPPTCCIYKLINAYMSLHINIMYNYVVIIQHNAIIMINNDLCNDIAHE